MAAKRKGAPSRKRTQWPEATDRYAAWVESGPKVQAFERAARALIAPGKTSDQWTPLEHAAMKLVEHLEHCFGGGGGAEWKHLFERALKAMERGGYERRRYYAVRTIREFGARWRALPASTRRAERMSILGDCARQLAFHDAAFAVLGEKIRSTPRPELPAIAAKLDVYADSASGLRDAKGAEAIVAELVYELDDDVEHNILGIKVNARADEEDEIERIRKRLDSDAREYLNDLKS